MPTHYGDSSAYPLNLGGRARVVDGDTLQIGHQYVRLHGVDAVEVSGLAHTPEGESWPAGELTKQLLMGEIEGQEVIGSIVETDVYGRPVAKVWRKDGSPLLSGGKYAYLFDLTPEELPPGAPKAQRDANRMVSREAERPEILRDPLAGGYIRPSRAVQEPAGGLWAEFANTLMHSATAGTAGLAAEAAQAVGVLVDSPSLKQWGSDLKLNIDTDSEWGLGHAPSVSDVRDIDSFDGAMRWLAGAAGSGLGFMATMAGTGVVGGLAARGGVKLAGKALGRQIAGRGAVKAGAVAGGIGAGTVMGLGEAYGQIRDELLGQGVPRPEAERRAAERGVLVAPLIGLLDAGGMVTAFGNPAKEVAKRGVLKAAGIGAARGMGIEGATEAAQTGLTEVAAAIETGNKDEVERTWRVLNAGLAGAVVGGPLGGVGGVARDVTSGVVRTPLDVQEDPMQWELFPEDPGGPVAPPPPAPGQMEMFDVPEPVPAGQMELFAPPVGAPDPGREALDAVLDDMDAFVEEPVPAGQMGLFDPPVGALDPGREALDAALDDMDAFVEENAPSDPALRDQLDSMDQTVQELRAAPEPLDPRIEQAAIQEDEALGKAQLQLGEARQAVESLIGSENVQAVVDQAFQKVDGRTRTAQTPLKESARTAEVARVLQSTAKVGAQRQAEREKVAQAQEKAQAETIKARQDEEKARQKAETKQGMRRDPAAAAAAGTRTADLTPAAREGVEQSARHILMEALAAPGMIEHGVRTLAQEVGIEEPERRQGTPFSAKSVKRPETWHEVHTKHDRALAAARSNVKKVTRRVQELSVALDFAANRDEYGKMPEETVRRLRIALRVVEEMEKDRGKKLAAMEESAAKKTPPEVRETQAKLAAIKRAGRERAVQVREERRAQKAAVPAKDPEVQKRLEALPEAAFAGTQAHKQVGAMPLRPVLNIPEGTKVGDMVRVARADGRVSAYEVKRMTAPGKAQGKLEALPPIVEPKPAPAITAKVVGPGAKQLLTDRPDPELPVSTTPARDPGAERVDAAIEAVKDLDVLTLAKEALPSVVFPEKAVFRGEARTKLARARQKAIQQTFERWYLDPRYMVALYRQAYPDAKDVREKVLRAYRALEGAYRGGEAKPHVLGFLLYEMGARMNASNKVISRYEPHSVAEVGSVGGSLRHYGGKFALLTVDPANPVDAHLLRGQMVAEALAKSEIGMPGELANRLKLAMSPVRVVEEDCGAPTLASVEVQALDPAYHAGAIGAKGGVLTSETIADLKTKTGSVRIRVPTGCASKGGVCGKCCGHIRALGGISKPGDPVAASLGFNAALSVTEPMQQAVISSFKDATLVKGEDVPLMPPVIGLSEVLMSKTTSDKQDELVRLGQDFSDAMQSFGFEVDPTLVRLVGMVVATGEPKSWLKKAPLLLAHEFTSGHNRVVGREPRRTLDELKRLGVVTQDVTIEDIFADMNETPGLIRKAQMLTEEVMQGSEYRVDGRIPFANEEGRAEYDREWSETFEATLAALQADSGLYRDATLEQQILLQIRALQDEMSSLTDPEERTRQQHRINVLQRNLLWINAQEFTRSGGVYDQIRKDKRKTGRWASAVYAYLTARSQRRQDRIDVVEVPAETVFQVYRDEVLDAMESAVTGRDRLALSRLVRETLDAAREGRTIDEHMYTTVSAAIRRVAKARAVIVKRYPLTHRHNEVALNVRVHDNPADQSITLHNALLAGYAGDFDGDGYKVFAAPKGVSREMLMARKGPAQHMLKFGDGSAQMMPAGDQGEGLVYWMEAEGLRGVVKRAGLKGDALHALHRAVSDMPVRLDPVSGAKAARKLVGQLGVRLAKEGEVALEVYSALWKVGAAGKQALLKLPGALHISVPTKNTAVPYRDGLLHVVAAAKALEGNPVDVAAIERKLDKAKDVPLQWQTKGGTPLGTVSQEWFAKNIETSRQAEILNLRAKENVKLDKGVFLPRNEALRRPDGKPLRRLSKAERERSDRAINTLIRSLGVEQFSIEDTRGPEGFTFVESTRGIVNTALIRANLNVDQAVWTVGHEVIHALRQGNIFTDEQWADLVKQADDKWVAKYNIKARYPELSKDLQREEAVSEAFGEFLHNTRFREGLPALAHKALWLLSRVLRVLGRRLLNMNIFTWQDYFDAVADGRILRGMSLGQTKADRDKRQEQRLGKGGTGLSERARKRAVVELTVEGEPMPPQPAVLQRWAEIAKSIARNINRHSEMPNTTENAPYLMLFREHLTSHELGDRKVRQALVQVFGDLTPQQEAGLDFIALTKDAAEGWAENIQSAISEKQVAKDLPLVQELLKDPVIAERYQRFRSWANDLRDTLIRKGMLDKSTKKREHYFHRIILKYAGEKRGPITRAHGLARSQAFRREGSKEAYSGSLRESMQDLLYSGWRQVARNDVWEKMLASPDVNFKPPAMEAVIEYNRRLLEDALEDHDDKALVARYNARQKKIVKGTLRLREALQQEMTPAFRKTIPDRLTPVFDTFMDVTLIEENRALPTMAFAKWLADNKDGWFSPELAETADTLFTDVLARTKLASKVVGEDYVDPFDSDGFVDGLKKVRDRFEDLDVTPHLPAGYTLDDLTTATVDTRWGGRHSILAQIADEALHTDLMNSVKTLKRGEAIPEPVWAAMREYFDSTQVRLVAGTSREWVVVHKGVAKDMDASTPVTSKVPAGPATKALQRANSMFKQVILLSAPQFVGYQIRNLSGDAEGAFIADPSLFKPATFKKYFKRALKKGIRLDIKNEVGDARDEQAIRLAVTNTGEGAAELSHEIAREGLEGEAGEVGPEMQRLMNDIDMQMRGQMTAARAAKLMVGVLTGKKLAKYNLLRENFLRRMLFEKKMDELDALWAEGKVDMDDPRAVSKALGFDYKTVNMKVLRGIKDPTQMVGYFIREALIDYQSTSKLGLGMGGSRFLIPFYGWMHGNSKRFFHQFRNLAHAWREEGLAGGASASLRASGMLLARTFMVTALIALYNGMRRELSPHCGEGHESRPQIILWCDEEHTVTLSTPGALIDLLSWVGISGYEDVAQIWRDVESGRRGGVDIVMGMGQAMVGKGAAMTGPLLKVPIEVAGGVSFFPSPFEPRPIEGGVTGKVRHVVRAFGGPTPSNLFDYVTGRPLPFGGEKHTAWDNFGFLAQNVAVKRTDSGRIAYNASRGMVFDWIAANLPETGGVRGGTPLDHAYTQHALARRYGQRRLQRDWGKEIVKLERERARALRKPLRDIRKLIGQHKDNAHPLKHIPENLRPRFLASLSLEERAMLRRALRWWATTY